MGYARPHTLKQTKVALVVTVVVVALLAARGPLLALAGDGVGASVKEQVKEQICDPTADYFLGLEDYPRAIELHRQVIRRDPSNALAHYHLGFAYGITGHHKHELSEYRKAIDLGFDDWQLFLNLGLLYLEQGHLRVATDVLRLAALLGDNTAETHFNLGLALERRGMLGQAAREMLVAARLDPAQDDARNMLGVIYAEQGRLAQARAEWTAILRARPDYLPARMNLSVLTRLERTGAPAHEPVRPGTFARTP